MKSFPLFLNLQDRTVAVVGGGEQAAQKVRLMLKTQARIVVIAPVLDPELAGLADVRRIDHVADTSRPDVFRDVALVFIATEDGEDVIAIRDMAKSAGALVNVVDQPDLCDVTTPSIVDRDPVVVAIGTEGTAPVLARQIKTRVEQMLAPNLGSFAALAGRLRGAVADAIPDGGDRRRFWRDAFTGAAWAAHKRGSERQAATLLKAAISDAGKAPARQGTISLIGAGPGARDLLTLRAVERLQEADIIFYDRLVDPDVLELARRDAERVCVGKAVGANQWPQERITALVISAARQGKSVVRLKSGDPCVFGRAGEEAEAARAADIPVEIVPGITAASAAVAGMGQALTQRGRTHHVTLATGTSRPGAEDPNWGDMLRPGGTLALYMAVANAGKVQKSLLTRGVPTTLPVHIVENASTSRERHLTTSLGELSDTVTRDAVQNPAILLIEWPENVAAALCIPA
ncbi:siroheme synthase CysG [Shimia biformata]|uniref:siroheme synthase CysG n=1 Tax=Shimia biformata TaxID=1294299 RepID=UPI00194E2A42|nr:siroheme synthase CysG [Shimia biformata]